MNNRSNHDAYAAFLDDLCTAVGCLRLFDSSVSESLTLIDLHGRLAVMAHKAREMGIAMRDAGHNAETVAYQESMRLFRERNPELKIGPDLTDPAESMLDIHTYEEMEIEVLKLAVVEPILFNQLREIFLGHSHPSKLDESGRLIRDVFINLRNEQCQKLK